MNRRMLRVLICTAVMLSLASSRVCTIFASHPTETPCQKNKPFDKRIGLETTGQCTMLPCHGREGQPLSLLGNVSAG